MAVTATGKVGPLRAAIYCRVSTAGQEDNASLGTQEEQCRTLAAEQGWDVAAIYRDVHTGVDLYERPELGRLREAMRHRQIDAVVCYSTDRLSRDPVHLGLVQYEATYYGIELAFVTDTYDTSFEGQMLAMVRGIAGKIEYERLKDRTRRGMQGRLAKGLPLAGNKAPYGYRWADEQKSRLLIHDDEAGVLRDAFCRIAGGEPVRSIVRELNERTVPTATGRGRWVPQSLNRMLRNPVYAGRRTALQREYFDVQVPGVGRRKRCRQREAGTVVMPHVAPPLVPGEVFAAVQRRLDTNKERSLRNNRQPVPTLLRGGFVRCGYCGNALQARSIQGKRIQYICQNRYQRSDCPPFAMEAHLLDAEVWRRVEHVLLDPDVIAAEVARHRERGLDETLLRGAERRVAEGERKRHNLIRRLASIDDDAIAESVQSEIGLLQTEINTARDVLAELQRQHAEWSISQAHLDDLRARLDLVAANLAQLDYSGQRLALDALGVEVKLWAADHEPRFQITMSVASPGVASGRIQSLVLS